MTFDHTGCLTIEVHIGDSVGVRNPFVTLRIRTHIPTDFRQARKLQLTVLSCYDKRKLVNIPRLHSPVNTTKSMVVIQL